MPSRIIDGEAIWSSDKLKAASKIDELSAGLYCWLLPLAEGNGVFEYDVNKIYIRTISFQFKNYISKERLENILEIYRNLGLLYVWKRSDRLYGFWTNIDKRLPKQNSEIFKYRFPNPSMDRVKRYMNSCREKVKEILCTESVISCTEVVQRVYEPCTALVQTSRQPIDSEEDNPPEVLGLGFRVEGEEEREENMALADKLRNEIYERTGKTPKLSDWLVTEFRKRVGTEKEKLAAFREYLTSNPDSEYPLHEFLDSDIEAQLTNQAVVSGIISNPALLSLASKVFTIADFAVSGKSLTAAENLLKIYPELDILNAFRYFYGKLDDFGRKHAVRDFFANGAAEPVILAMKEYQQHQVDIIKRAEAVPVLPVPVRKTEEDQGENIDF